MGIQLPPELSAVAAQAGVAWPEADEDKMREQAAAWRDAGTKLTNLTRDADRTASTTLNAVAGSTGDAARRHWSAFVAPDTGHLTATAHGCTAAADRLDHAANQVGAAKVEIVRNLVALAKNSDAAHQAAGAGHPHALLGLDTAVRATNANVTHITNSLATAVVPGSGVDVNVVQPLLNPNPGQHDPLETVAGLGASGPDHRGPLETVSTVTQGGTQIAAGTVQTIADTGQSVTTAPGETLHRGGEVVARVGDGVTQTVADLTPGGSGSVGAPGVAGPGQPDITGPVRVPPVDVGPVQGSLPVDVGPGRGPLPVDVGPGHGALPVDAPTPPTGIPAGPGQTVQAGLAPGGILDPAAPAQVSPGAATGFGGASPGAGGAPGQGIAPGPAGGPLGGAGPVAPAPGPGPTAGPAPAPSAPGGPPAASARPPGPGTVLPPAGPPPVAAPPPAARLGVPDAGPIDAARGRGPLTNAVPPGPAVPPQPQAAAPQVIPKERREDGPLLFWMHMFPIGHMPVVSDRPARQLPTPPAELDFAPGLRFPPGDHPQHVEIDATPGDRVPVDTHDGLPADHPAVAALAAGHDPLGGQHEREWDRRYLVRLGSVTAQGISSAGKEYAWPPGESYPEGGSAEGDAGTLNEGTVIDRFGSPRGRVFSADGTAFARRSLPPEHLAVGYRRYLVLRPLPVWRTVSAPWFGQPGGGERYRATYSATELVALGYLEDIT